MGKRYRVHSYHIEKREIAAVDADGNAVTGLALVGIAELVPLDTLSGSIREVVRLPTPEHEKQAAEFWAEGGTIECQGWAKIEEKKE